MKQKGAAMEHKKASQAILNHTFILQIKSQENNTWQGTIEWVEDRKVVPFRSALELIRLLDSAMQDED